MAKTKTMTAAEVDAIMERVEELTSDIRRMDDAISKLRIEDIREPREYGERFVCMARDASDLALRLFTRADLQDMTAKTKELREKLEGDSPR